MSVAFPEGDPEAGILPPEVSNLERSITKFDAGNEDLLVACAVFAQDPSPAGTSELNGVASLQAHNFRRVVSEIAQAEPDSVKRIEIIVTLWRGDDAKRVARLKELSDCEDFSLLPGKEKFETDLKEALLDADDEEEFFDALNELYIAGLQDDLQHFLSHSVQNAHSQNTGEDMDEDEPEPRRKALLKALGMHAFDVAKIGAAVALGILVTRRKKS